MLRLLRPGARDTFNYTRNSAGIGQNHPIFSLKRQIIIIIIIKISLSFAHFRTKAAVITEMGEKERKIEKVGQLFRVK